MTSDELILVATAFYKPEDILKAKELIFNLCKEKITTRKTCQSHPNPILADTQDIINLITKKDNGSSTLPKFVTGGCYSLPPTTGCIAFARAFNRLRDELSEVKTEMRELRSTKDKEAKAIEDSNDVRQDISDIKTMLIKEIVPTNAHENPETQSREQERDRPSSTSYRDSLNRKPGPFVGKRNAISGTVRNAPNVSETYSANRPPRPQQNRPKPQTIFGSRKEPNEGESDFEIVGAPRRLDIYVGRTDLKTTAAKIISHCEKYGNPKFIHCTELSAKYDWYKSFKVTVDFNCQEQMLTPEFWPEGIVVRKFTPRRNRPSTFSN